jgi:hypothetical protein
MSAIIDEVRQLLKGRDFETPGDAAILLECISVVIDTKVTGLLPPATLEAALRIIEDEHDPEFREHRRHWCAYLRTMPKIGPEAKTHAN